MTLDLSLADTLDRAVDLYKRYVTFTNDDFALICALWCAHTWLFRPKDMHGIETTGYLAFVSPVPNCGKTNALTVTSALSRGQPSLDITPTSAPLFRSIGEKRDTLIFDELDSLLAGSDIVSVLNAGYKRGAQVKRMTGRDKDQITTFETFCPKALGYIRDQISLKAIKNTLESRCIKILLKRRTAKEQRESAKLRHRELKAEAENIVYNFSKWEYAAPSLSPIFPTVIMDELTGREMEVWENLLSIAYMAGRLREAKRTALELVMTNREEGEDHNSDLPLLADLRTHLEKCCDVDGFSTDIAAKWLIRMEDRTYDRWFKDGSPLTGAALSRILAKYGVRPRAAGATRRRRIRPDAMEDVFLRHLPLPGEGEEKEEDITA